MNCGDCKYYLPHPELQGDEKEEFERYCKSIGIDNYDYYGYCIKFPDSITIVSGSNGSHCRWWESD